MAGARRGQRGLTRMDAAVDHLAQMGFEKVDIRKTVKELLKEYGGPDGWVFIEDSSYKLVIEQLLGDQEGSEPGAPHLSDAASQENMHGDAASQENMHGDAASSSAAGPQNAITSPDLDTLDVGKTCADGNSHQGSAVTSLDDVHQDATNNEDEVFPPGLEYTTVEITHSPPLPPPPPRPRKLNHAPPPPPEMEIIPPPPPPRPRKLNHAPPPPPEMEYIPPPPPPPRHRKLNHAPPPPPEMEYIPPPPPPPPEMEPSSPLPPRPRKLKHAPPPPPPPPPPRSPPPEREPTLPRVRRPCYGWWGEESEIITLPVMPVKFNGAR